MEKYDLSNCTTIISNAMGKCWSCSSIGPTYFTSMPTMMFVAFTVGRTGLNVLCTVAAVRIE